MYIFIFIYFYSHANINYERTSPWHAHFFIVNLQMYVLILFPGVFFFSFFFTCNVKLHNFLGENSSFGTCLFLFNCFHD
jgi:hypothetical protein